MLNLGTETCSAVLEKGIRTVAYSGKSLSFFVLVWSFLAIDRRKILAQFLCCKDTRKDYC